MICVRAVEGGAAGYAMLSFATKLPRWLAQRAPPVPVVVA